MSRAISLLEATAWSSEPIRVWFRISSMAMSSRPEMPKHTSCQPGMATEPMNRVGSMAEEGKYFILLPSSSASRLCITVMQPSDTIMVSRNGRPLARRWR